MFNRSREYVGPNNSLIGNIDIGGIITGPTIEEIHKKIEDSQMSVEELESAIHYIVNMELKHVIDDIECEFYGVASEMSNFTSNHCTDIHLELDRLSNQIGISFFTLGANIRKKNSMKG